MPSRQSNISFDAETFPAFTGPRLFSDCETVKTVRDPFIADSFHCLPWDTSCSTFAPARSACGAKDFETGKMRLNSDPRMFPKTVSLLHVPAHVNGKVRPFLSVTGRSIVRTDCDCRRSSKVSSLPPEMKRHHRFTEFERYRFADFVIYRDFDGVELAPSHRHVMRSVVNDVNGSAVFARNVYIPARWGSGIAVLRYLVRRRSTRT
jgi:hypothetical protein